LPGDIAFDDGEALLNCRLPSATASLASVHSEAGEPSGHTTPSVKPLRQINEMTQEESLVLSFLQERPESAFSRGEIGRRAAKRKVYEADPHWVDVPLASLVARGLVEVDINGNYLFGKAS
jgi:hypothetical protein